MIKSRIPSLQSLISKTIAELDSELSRLGRPVATDAGVGSELLSVFFSVFPLIQCTDIYVTMNVGIPLFVL